VTKQSPRFVMKDFMEDYIIALRWFPDPKNREEAAKITASFTKRPARIDEGYAFTDRDFYRSPMATPDIQALQRNIDLMQDLGVIKQKVDVSPVSTSAPECRQAAAGAEAVRGCTLTSIAGEFPGGRAR